MNILKVGKKKGTGNNLSNIRFIKTGRKKKVNSNFQLKKYHLTFYKTYAIIIL